MAHTTTMKPAVGIIGTKLGMTQLFDGNGVLRSATVVKGGPCVVVQRKGSDRDGYAAVQLALIEERQGERRPAKRPGRPMQGHFKKAGVPPARVVREMRLGADSARPDLAPGTEVTAAEFSAGDVVDVVGVSKGKGFQGVVKRHHFRGGAATHGSMFHRAPGSIGASAFPSRVFKGTRMGGHMGSDRVTAKNLEILRVDAESHLLFIEGSVPGGRNGIVVVKPAKSPRRPSREASRSEKQAKPGKAGK